MKGLLPPKLRSFWSIRKYKPKALSGLLQLTSPPNSIWEDITMDFVTSVPIYQGNIVMMVVIAHFLKAGHFEMLPTNLLAYKHRFFHKHGL